jgi:hypothetical protein
MEKIVKNPYLSSNILQRWYTYKSKYLREFETKFKNILGCESEAHMGSIHEKKKPEDDNLVPLYL